MLKNKIQILNVATKYLFKTDQLNKSSYFSNKNFQFNNGFFFSNFKNCAACDGKTTKASISEPIRAQQTTTGITFINSPKTPPMENIGRNAAIVVSVETTTGQNTSLAPSDAASKGGIPSSMCRNTFSVTIIASSTIIPSTIKKANSETMLIVKSKEKSRITANRKETGIPKAVINATLKFNNKYSDNKTNIKPIRPDDLTTFKRVLT